MASRMKDALMATRATHTVGTINSDVFKTFINGAIVSETNGIDNYTFAQLYFENGVAKCKKPVAGATSVELFITASPEDVLDQFGELMGDFYNGKDEMATLVYPTIGLTFQTSNFVATDLAVGDYVIYDITTGQFREKVAEDTGITILMQVTDLETEDSYTIDAKDLVQLTIVQVN